jgi:hypothetical protein
MLLKNSAVLNQTRMGAFICSALRRIAIVQCNKENVLAMNEGPLTLTRRLEGTPPLGKELPMELTATVTAIMAIMSFGFLAAVILGMI